MPDDDMHAAAFPLTFPTAWHMLVTRAQRRSNASEQFGKIALEF